MIFQTEEDWGVLKVIVKGEKRLDLVRLLAEMKVIERQ